MPSSKTSRPPYRLVVVPWLRPIGQRFVLPQWLAITFGRWIVSWRALDEAELAHELTHVAQWRRHGLRFIPLYLRESWRAARAGGDRYHDNIFEAQARAAAEAARRQRP